MRRLGAIVAASAAFAAGSANAAAATPRVVIAVMPGQLPSSPASFSLDRFAAAGFTTLGLLSSSVGNYDRPQVLIDITQAARVPAVDYSPRSLAPPTVANRTVEGWGALDRRAGSVRASLLPGLLASRIPGGVAYAAAASRPRIDAVLAADRRGHIAAISLGSSSSLVTRVENLLATHRVVVVDLAGTADGLRRLHALLLAREQNELLLALEQPPRDVPADRDSAKLLAIAAAGLSARRSSLRSPTTRTDGLVTAIDLAPTVLHWLHLRAPGAFVGEPITTAPARSLASLRSFESRMQVIEGRRTPAILAFLAAWLALLALAALTRTTIARPLRLGAIAVLWLPSTALLAAAVAPGAVAEVAIVVGLAYALALPTDRFAPWPRAPAVPVAAMLVLYTFDLARGSPLLNLSLLTANPISGSRFYGVGNDLEAVLAVMGLVGLAAALPQRRPTARDAALLAAGGALLTLIVTWGRLGADAGAIFTIGGATAVATVLATPGALTWRRVALGGAAVLGALGLLAVIDLATGGGAHFTHSIIHAHSSSALLDTLRRRLAESWDVLLTGAVWIAVIVCLAVAAAVIRFRRTLLAPVAPVWGACLGGGLAGAVLGSIANDSGPRVLFVGAVMLTCALAYVRGAPRAVGGS